jgi:alginate O-acetyltransferase complex protein AlgI
LQPQGALFHGICYAVLFAACVAVVSRTKRPDLRQSALLFASLALYLTWMPWFAAVLCTSIIINFLIGKWLTQTPHWLPLSLGITFNLLLLFAFKYLPEFSEDTQVSALHRFGALALPLGISFWTFQALSYLFDLYREEELDPTLPEFALYMTFFPVTISGPVCRMPDMLPQFRSEKLTPRGEIAIGLQRIAIGVFMMQLAKLLGQGILAGDGIGGGFDRTQQWSGPDVWCLAFGYGLQLFFDFAGYSHIAIGAARALGIIVPENFDRPFASTNPSIFWTRWHMSLSFWIRDYVFFPLAALRRELWWRYLALALSMVAFGIWHQATILFLIWGSYHGVLLVLHRQMQHVERKLHWEPRAKFWTALSWILTSILISFGWIFFRANSLSQARTMLAALISMPSYSQHFLNVSLYYLVAALAIGYALVLYVAGRFTEYSKSPAQNSSGAMAVLARWRWFWIPSLYAMALLFVFLITHGQEASAGQLMYRRF